MLYEVITKLKDAFSRRDINRVLQIEVPEGQEPKGCQCGLVLRGVKIPTECRLFGKACTPEHPVGACMVSTEGSCAAYYKYSAMIK